MIGPNVNQPNVTAPKVQEIRVKVADYAVANGESIISTIGLGSCVAIMLYDGSSRIGGLAHILLPSEGLSLDSDNRAKFPSTAIPLLLDEMRKRGAWGRPMAKIVGGASMFASRASTHLPFCFFRIESVWPARVMDGALPDGVTTTVSFVP